MIAFDSATKLAVGSNPFHTAPTISVLQFLKTPPNAAGLGTFLLCSPCWLFRTTKWNKQLMKRNLLRLENTSL
ncbi:hypothetical protein FRX31_019387 [Thalictrum thalictroides]|uniref:Uncharacterized protein n=1 Tax=Thalictrum thalictroides TaxID=46969 RepID=A0A7J6W3X2_THATH|nr:hypothetical protein FRX31_019387 [Thalictrum thalictroides]